MSEWDKDIKVGDLIVAYHAGFHQVTRIVRRFYTQDDMRYQTITDKGGKIGDEYNALIYYKTIVDSKGKPAKGKNKREKSCDAIFCVPAIPEILKEIRDHQETIERLTKLVAELSK